MTSKIHVYVEGGGDRKDTRSRLRKGLQAFLGELHKQARKKRGHVRVQACGGRTSAFDDFKTALTLRQHRDTFDVLLVDSEGPVSCDSPWEHLKNRAGDEWENPGAEDKHCHLMVQTMEAWLIADREKLCEYYGQKFYDKHVPARENVEEIPKDSLRKALEKATRHTPKGKYHKTRHAPEILERIRPSEVRAKAPHCKRLFDTIARQIDGL